MMSSAEIASLLLRLLAETRTYRCVKFDCLHLPAAEQIKFGIGLLKLLPEPDRNVIEMVFELAHADITTERMASCLATHPMPEVVQ